MGYRLLAVSKDKSFVTALRSIAQAGHYDLSSVATGAKAIGLIESGGPDMVLVESKLPDMEGLSWLKMMRQTEAGRGLPALVISEVRVDGEVAEAYQWGADDYILKSCDPTELAARIRAVLRRRFEREEVLGRPMALGAVVLDPAKHVCLVRGKRIPLRPREFELLEILMRKSGRVLSRGYLLEAIWGMSGTADTRAVDVGISRLRQALGPRAGRWIETVERFGYRFGEPW